MIQDISLNIDYKCKYFCISILSLVLFIVCNNTESKTQRIEMKKKDVMNIRISKEEKKELELASKMSEISMSRILVNGGIKEAKRILKQIEKGQ